MCDEDWDMTVSDSPVDIVRKRQDPAIARREELLRDVSTAKADAVGRLSACNWKDCIVTEVVLASPYRTSGKIALKTAAFKLGYEAVTVTRLRRIKVLPVYLTSKYVIVFGNKAVDLEALNDDTLRELLKALNEVAT